MFAERGGVADDVERVVGKLVSDGVLCVAGLHGAARAVVGVV